MSTRVLVVDDHERWRRYVASAVRTKPGCHVVGEVADGLEAVRQAEKLRPELILLDVGLPTLNGVEAARRILASVPDCRILFLSEHCSADIASAAMRLGAFGYLLKSDAGSELLPAIRAIIEGKLFISVRLTARLLESVKDEGIRQGLRRHELDVCPDEAAVLDGFARFVERALENGSATILITTQEH